MEREAIHSFLSEESVLRHKSYLRQLELEYSVLLASEAGLNGKCAAEIALMRINSDIREEAYFKCREIELHKLYFCSFVNENKRCENLPDGFRSPAELLYEIYRVANDVQCADFIVLLGDKRNGRIRISSDKKIGIYDEPLLALDLCEHAYFSDYGFLREQYLKNAISHLNLSAVSDFISAKCAGRGKKGLK